MIGELILIVLAVLLLIFIATFVWCAMLINREENDEWKKK